MKEFYVDYSYVNCWGDSASGRSRFEDEESARQYLDDLQENREVSALTLITYEKII